MALPRVDAFDPVLEQRVVSSLVLAAGAVAAVIVGGWPFALLVVGAIVIMAGEWVRLFPEGSEVARKRCLGVIIGLGAAPLLLMQVGRSELALAAIVLGPALAAAVGALLPGTPPNRVAGGVVYVGLPALALVWLRMEPVGGMAHVLWLMIVVWSTDVMAYFAGRSIGGPRLAPRISPSKTWAGLLGGVTGAGLAGGLAAALGGAGFLAPMALAMLLALVSQAGDLFESSLKRHAGKKDSGHLIPGHGGLLDRVDGLAFSAPVFAAVIWLYAGASGA